MPRQFYQEADGTKVFPKAGAEFTSDELAARFGVGFVPPSFKPEVPVEERPGKIMETLDTVSDVAMFGFPGGLAAKAGKIAVKAGLKGGARLVAQVLGGEAGVIGAKAIKGEFPTPTDFLVEGTLQGVGAGVASAVNRVFSPRATQKLLPILRDKVKTGATVTPDERALFTRAFPEELTGAVGDEIPTLNAWVAQNAVPGAVANIKRETRAAYAAVRASGKNLLPRKQPTHISETASNALDELGDVGGVAQAETSKLRAILIKIRDRGRDVPVKGKDGKTLVDLNGIEVTTPAKDMTFREYEDLMSDMREIVPDFNMRLFNTTTRSEGIMDNLMFAINKEMQAMAKGTPTEGLLRTANERFRTEWLPQRGQLETIVRNTTGEMAPSELLDSLILSNNTTKIGRIRMALPEREWNLLREGWLVSRIEKHIDPFTGIFNAADMFDDLNGLKPAVRRMVFENSPDLKKVFDALESSTTIQRKIPRLAQAGGRGGAAAAAVGTFGMFQFARDLSNGRISPTSMAQQGTLVFLLPYILTHRKAQRLFAGMIVSGDRTKESVRLGSMLISELGLGPLLDMESRGEGGGTVLRGIAGAGADPGAGLQGFSSAAQN